MKKKNNVIKTAMVLAEGMIQNGDAVVIEYNDNKAVVKRIVKNMNTPG